MRADYRSMLEGAESIADVFEVVKSLVQRSTGMSRGGLMLGMANLGNNPRGLLGGFLRSRLKLDGPEQGSSLQDQRDTAAALQAIRLFCAASRETFDSQVLAVNSVETACNALLQRIAKHQKNCPKRSEKLFWKKELF